MSKGSQWEWVISLPGCLDKLDSQIITTDQSLMVLVAFIIYNWFEDNLVQNLKGCQKSHFYKTSHNLTWLVKPCIYKWHFIYLFIYLFCIFAFSRAAPTAYGGSQARGPVGAVAAGLYQSHSKAKSELRPPPTPQLTAMPTEQSQGSNLQHHGS